MKNRKPKLTKEAKEILVKACVSMLQNPHKYDQCLPWIPKTSDVNAPNAILGCGSAGCIYGFIGLYAPIDLRNDIQAEVNRVVLNMHPDWSGMFHKLFWPPEYKLLFECAKTNRQRAVVAIARVRHFMRAGE